MKVSADQRVTCGKQLCFTLTQKFGVRSLVLIFPFPWGMPVTPCSMPRGRQGQAGRIFLVLTFERTGVVF